MPRPLLVEVVGLPGVGKSTFTQAMHAQDPRVVDPPILRRGHGRHLARHLVTTTATLAARGGISRRWKRNVLVMLAYLDALPPVLETMDSPPGTVVLFDQGPLFTLTRATVQRPRLRGWQDGQIARWAGLLDLVVWLEAPDRVLQERIDSRGKEHRLRGASADLFHGKLAHDRANYEDVLTRLAAQADGPPVMRVDTSQQTAGEIATEVLGKLHGR